MKGTEKAASGIQKADRDAPPQALGQSGRCDRCRLTEDEAIKVVQGQEAFLAETLIIGPADHDFFRFQGGFGSGLLNAGSRHG